MKRLIIIVLAVLIAPAILAQEPQTQTAAPTTAPTVAAPNPQPAVELPCMKDEMKPGKDAKIERFYPATPDKVKQAVVDAMKAVEFTVDKQTDTEVQGQRKRHFGVMVGSGGENLMVTLAPATEKGVSGTKVTAETKKTFAGRVGQKNWTDAVLERAGCLLKAQ
jgi:hypothetical protein